MPYSGKVLRQAKQALAQKKSDRESEYRSHLAQAYQQIPRLKEIDMLLRKSMAVAAQTVFTKGEDAQQTLQQVKEANLALQQERETIISQNLPAGYLNEEPVCHKCGGSGYLGSTMCSCLAQLCKQEQMKELSVLTDGTQRFDTFRLEYYSDRVDKRYGASERVIMQKVLDYCRRYAESFSCGSGNMLFVGNTGLGKTFLSACVANAVADQGYSVCYESAPRLFSKLEKNRFNPDEESNSDAQALLDCDLLIVDDLGTEMPGTFVTAALYSLLNDRLLQNKSMLISTNLNIDEIAKRYSPQIASRLQGSFKGLTFVGEDIRVQKSRGVLV